MEWWTVFDQRHLEQRIELLTRVVKMSLKNQGALESSNISFMIVVGFL